MGWEVDLKSRNVAQITIKYSGLLDQWVFLSADRHWDNPKSNQQLQKKHLDQAKEHNAPVLDFGDFFCAMQGKWDKRSSKDEIRPEHQVSNYLDALVETAGEFFAPYAELMVTLARGNHEQSVMKRHEVNLIHDLCKELRRHNKKSPAYDAGYSGWVVFDFKCQGERPHRRAKEQVRLHYIHGYGGGGPVTRDVTQTNRKAVYLPDADIVVSGHTHDAFVVPIARVRLNSNLEIVQDEQLHVKIPTYKDDYSDGFDGFHVEKGRGPRPIGAYWLHFYTESVDGPVTYQIERAN